MTNTKSNNQEEISTKEIEKFSELDITDDDDLQVFDDFDQLNLKPELLKGSFLFYFYFSLIYYFI